MQQQRQTEWEAMTVQLLTSETIFQGRVFAVRRDRLLLPNGHEATLEVVAHNDAVTILPLDAEGYIWFIRQYRHAAGRELLELPAGVAETGEEAATAALRELREEIGMAADKIERLGGFYLAPGYSTEYMHVFLASDLYPSPLKADLDEILRVEKIAVRQALHLAETGELQDAKSLVALCWALPRLRRLGWVD